MLLTLESLYFPAGAPNMLNNTAPVQLAALALNAVISNQSSGGTPSLDFSQASNSQNIAVVSG